MHPPESQPDYSLALDEAVLAGSASGPSRGLSTWAIVKLAALLAAAGGAFGWAGAFGSAWVYPLAGFTGALAAMTGSSVLERLGNPRRRAYRWGFGMATGLAVLLGASGGLPALAALFGILAGVFGAAAGCLALTGLLDGLWEDNYPPSDEIQGDVLRRHRVNIGVPPAASAGKRIFDLALSAVGLIGCLPLTLAIALAIWLEDPGPVLFVKNSVGKGGANFRQLKFRTMVREAEKATGPVLASESDERVLHVGRFLRKTALDELPQLWNILIGEMSFVGPRPQRTVLVHGYLQQIPGYAERHRVSPGLAGLAQVVGSYYMPPEEKLHWDRIYISRAGLLYDLRLVGLALLIVFWLRWQKDWDEKIPASWVGEVRDEG